MLAQALAALNLALERIAVFHLRQSPRTIASPTRRRRLGSRWTAIEAVGLYVPGGTAAYPSSVLMNACPPRSPASRASRWWCRRRTACLEPLVLAAAGAAGIDEIFRVGGAQAVAALAYGTETIAPSPRSSGPATPMWPPPNAWCSAQSAST